MKDYKITNEEFEKVSISRLATNPGARTKYGEGEMKGEKLKARMDEPYLLFQKKFNALIELIGGNAEGDSLLKHLPTGISENHTLVDMINDVVSESAEFASYLSVGDRTLLEELEEIGKTLKLHNDHAVDQSNPHGVTAKQVGLGNVDNTSDEEKPLSAAARAAIEVLGREISDTEAKLIAEIAQALTSAKGYADDTKVGKLGDQTISGGLSIGGDLLVGGSTYAKQIESLEVGDAVIIANADGVLLSELSGYVIRVNGAAAYAIVYDPADDCVKIGLGVYDGESKIFTFGEGEAQVLATRGVIADGNIPVWNDRKKTFEDSGKSADKVVERGEDIPNGEIPVIKDGKLIGSGKTVSSFASKDSTQVVANALKGSASGEVVALKDVSPLEHSLGVRVSSKNLISYPFSHTSMTSNGITFTDNGDGSITVNGTATANAEFMFHSMFKMEPGTYRYTLFVTEDVSGLSGNVQKRTTEGSWVANLSNTTHDNGVFTLTDDDMDYLYGFNLYIVSGIVVNNVTIKPQLEVGYTATEYTPYVEDIGAVKVIVQGEEGEPIEYTVNPDGTVDGVKSIAPATTLTTDTEGVLIEVEYNKDINKAFAELQQAIILLGGIV